MGIPLALTATADDSSFTRTVRPILAEHCFPCHGPERQEAELRLDLNDFSAVNSVIGASSDLIRRIRSTDPDEMMPPPTANRPLSRAQTDILSVWSARGAPASRHWAFERIGNPVPPLRNSPWIANSIDSFVLAKLQRRTLGPSPPARRETLLRRASLSLTGLPPSLKLQDNFAADQSRDAFEKVVDQLLDSPAFGEHMAAQWMDVARFADTFGYDNDAPTRLWPWRDWVIRAFNQNLPYDKFTRWQVAGDMLPDPSTDQVLATAFSRLHRQNAEGGVIPEEFVVEYRMDRVQTFATAFLGLTLECARCHDHKFDPITQKDFYSLYALFSNIDELGTYAEKTNATPTPNLILYEADQQKQHTKLRTAISQLENTIAQAMKDGTGRFQTWLKSKPQLTVPPPAVHLSFADRSGMPGGAELVAGVEGNGVRFDGDSPMNIKDAGQFARSEAFSMAMWIRRPAGMHSSANQMTIFHNSKPVWEAGHRGVQLELLNTGHIQFTLCHFWPGNAIRVTTKSKIPEHKWNHLAVVWDGSGKASGVQIWIGGSRQPLTIVRDNLECEIKNDTVAPQLGGRRSKSGLADGALDEFRIWRRALTAAELVRLFATDAHTSADHLPTDLRTHYFNQVDERVAKLLAELRELRQQETSLATSVRRIMVMREHAAETEAAILNRGQYDQPATKVAGGVPASIREGSVNNRRDLADWMLHPEHPLVARVAVNRIWMTLWGVGLVATPEDFGSQGDIPEHRELLDHLAHSFMNDNWNVKRLCRRILMSATWQQSSERRADLTHVDPENRLLARGPQFRLSAEQIRDSALAASGLLSRTVGGPSVRPPQPDGLWREVGPQRFAPSEGDGRYRRSLYTYWKRTVPPPGMMIFDAVSREVCVARREATGTSAQALLLLNDPQYVEAARVLAGRILDETGQTPDTADAAIELAVRHLISRRPSHTEAAELGAALREQRELFAGSPNEAQALASTGPAPPAKADAVPHAALTSVVQIIMNLSEFQELR